MTKPQQTHGLTIADHGEKAIELIFAELRKAEAKHPGWPTDPIHAVAILIEEAGEATQAAIDMTYGDGSKEHLIEELAQAGAMAIRAMLHLIHEKPFYTEPVPDERIAP